MKTNILIFDMSMIKKTKLENLNMNVPTILISLKLRVL